MQSFAIVACLLASFAAANPVEIEPRSLGGMSASSQAHSASSSLSSVNAGGMGGGFGFGNPGVIGGMGGFGGGVAGGVSSYSQQSSSYYSSSMVMNSFSALCSQISAIQGMMSAGSFTQAIAMSQMSQLAVSMQSALSASVGCGCFGEGNLIGSVGSMFSQFSSMMMSMQSMFGQSCGPLFQPFGAISGSMQSFIHSFSSSGYSLNSIMGSGIPSVLNQAIPGMVNMIGFK